jgi:hypothetical protein
VGTLFAALWTFWLISFSLLFLSASSSLFPVAIETFSFSIGLSGRSTWLKLWGPPQEVNRPDTDPVCLRGGLLPGVALAACSLWIIKTDPSPCSPKKLSLLSLAGLLVVILPAVVAGKSWDQKTRSFQWRPYSLLAARETPLGSLALAEREGQYNFFTNGIFQFSSPDPRRAEEKTHLPLLFHPGPRHILLIGGGLSGSIREILKHPSVEQVTYVELDEDWVKARQVPSRLIPLLQNHPGIRLQYGDGRQIIKKKPVMMLSSWTSRAFHPSAQSLLYPKFFPG